MKRLISAALAAIGLVLAIASPAAAIDVQPGGRGGAEFTLGAVVIDRNDMQIDRCECDGGPLQEIVVHTPDGGGTIVRIDRLTAQLIRTNDQTPVVIGAIYEVTNLLGVDADNAIVLLVAVRDGALGPVQTIAVRRSAFSWTLEGGAVLNAGIAEIRAAVGQPGA